MLAVFIRARTRLFVGLFTFQVLGFTRRHCKKKVKIGKRTNFVSVSRLWRLGGFEVVDEERVVKGELLPPMPLCTW